MNFRNQFSKAARRSFWAFKQQQQQRLHDNYPPVARTENIHAFVLGGKSCPQEWTTVETAIQPIHLFLDLYAITTALR